MTNSEQAQAKERIDKLSMEEAEQAKADTELVMEMLDARIEHLDTVENDR